MKSSYQLTAEQELEAARIEDIVVAAARQILTNYLVRGP